MKSKEVMFEWFNFTLSRNWTIWTAKFQVWARLKIKIICMILIVSCSCHSHCLLNTRTSSWSIIIGSRALSAPNCVATLSTHEMICIKNCIMHVIMKSCAVHCCMFICYAIRWQLPIISCTIFCVICYYFMLRDAYDPSFHVSFH